VSPFAAYIGFLCRRFPGRLPSEVLAERAALPEGFLDEVAQSLAYADAVAANDARLPGGEDSLLRQIAHDIELELAEEEIAGRA
jgi:hypothetical protein